MGLAIWRLQIAFQVSGNSFENDSNAMLVLFGSIWVSFGDPGPPRNPQRRQGGKSSRKTCFGVLPWGSNRKRIEKNSFREARWNALSATCWTRNVSGPFPTMKTMVSCRRNHRFHVSTWSPETIERTSWNFNGFWDPPWVTPGTTQAVEG